MLEEAEKERLSLRAQNEDLVQRIVTDKTQNADEMNKMNAMVEQLRAQLGMAQTQQVRGRCGAPGAWVHPAHVLTLAWCVYVFWTCSGGAPLLVAHLAPYCH
jgi:hypothetical protein